MISINTSEFIRYKKAIIDGEELGFRVLSSAETLEILDLQERAKASADERKLVIKRLMDLIFETCDKPEKARDVLSGLSFDAVMSIYERVIESEDDA